MMIKVLLYLSIVVQFVAMYYAVRLIRITKYNAIWILFIIGFIILAGERLLQLLAAYGLDLPLLGMTWFDIVVSICMSIGIVLLDRLMLFTDRLNRHRQLTDRRILTAVLRAEERTRADFSKELHDGLGPLLSSAKISLSALSNQEMDSNKREIYNNTLYVVDEALRSLREISNKLSPHVLSDFGLARGVQHFIDRAKSMHDVKFTSVSNLGKERYDTDIEVVLYRVVCEFVTNSVKHADCSEIRLSLMRVGDVLELQYSDNGRGFVPEDMMDCGMGLSNINSRVNSLNGELEISSSIGKGMRATIKVNVKGAKRIVLPVSSHDKSRQKEHPRHHKADVKR
jgi:signal transduction histidine kinase